MHSREPLMYLSRRRSNLLSHGIAAYRRVSSKD